MQYNYTSADVARFWSKVEIRGKDDCWIWKGMIDKDGYGQVNFSNKHHRTHRVSYEIAVGKIPNSLCVLHKCDNRPCCNPNHLFAGTRKDNAQDMIRKGRKFRVQLYGEKNGNNKLSDQQVSEIRRRYATGQESMGKLAKAFGVWKGYISQLVNNKYRSS